MYYTPWLSKGHAAAMETISVFGEKQYSDWPSLGHMPTLTPRGEISFTQATQTNSVHRVNYMNRFSISIE